MNEHEWKKARDPEAMLATVQDRLSQRKWVLLNCVVARRMMDVVVPFKWEAIVDEIELGKQSGPEPVVQTSSVSTSHMTAVRVKILDPDGQGKILSPYGARVLKRAEDAMADASRIFDTYCSGFHDRITMQDRNWNDLRRSLSEVLHSAARGEILLGSADTPELGNDIRFIQKQLVLEMNKAMRTYAKPANELLAHFLHEQLGNPYQPYEFDPAWRTSDVMGLAKAIEADRGFDRMNMLADALMEAGCEHEGMLLHLQEEREHQRGCWVLDLILGHDTEVFARPPLEDVSGTGGRREQLGLAVPRNWDV